MRSDETQAGCKMVTIALWAAACVAGYFVMSRAAVAVAAWGLLLA